MLAHCHMCGYERQHSEEWYTITKREGFKIVGSGGGTIKEQTTAAHLCPPCWRGVEHTLGAREVSL
ncbi:hypothetical protein LCGC14_2769290 [marine sediment metagenome]|uniref:Uncharacterized protein n=1 Tax=marine sediment metagenome TaxID=412755 RepID=A0A0F8YWJ5_9ZZZZ